MTTPAYTIAMCNYNMERTLEPSLSSILDQLDERFEVLVVDDGSNDNSVSVIKSMQAKYPSLRLIELKRDPKRKLGLTRNISVQEARGEYVLLHLDCDDLYGPFLKDFVSAFHQIEKAIGKDVLLSGQHINMARREFLLQHGPYKNIFRGEDRNLWVRLAAIGAYIPFDHVDFVTRMPKTAKERNTRSILYTWDHLQNDFRSGATIPTFLYYEFTADRGFSWKIKLCRLLFMIPAWFAAKFQEQTPPPAALSTPEKFNDYRTATRGTFAELLKRYKCEPDFSEMSADAQKIFVSKGS